MVVCELCHSDRPGEELHEVFACTNCTKHNHLVLNNREKQALIATLSNNINDPIIKDILERLSRD